MLAARLATIPSRPLFFAAAISCRGAAVNTADKRTGSRISERACFSNRSWPLNTGHAMEKRMNLQIGEIGQPEQGRQVVDQDVANILARGFRSRDGEGLHPRRG